MLAADEGLWGQRFLFLFYNLLVLCSQVISLFQASPTQHSPQSRVLTSYNHYTSPIVYVFCSLYIVNDNRVMDHFVTALFIILIITAEYIDMGWDGPAGNMYASTSDLAQLMMMLFRDNQTYDPSKGQVRFSWNSCTK